MNKITFDNAGNVGTVQGEYLLPILENEKLICNQSDADILGLKPEQWLTLEQLRELPNNFADIAYKIFTGGA